jgi:hypothetical protein
MGVLKLAGFTSRRAMLPELSTAVGSVKLTGRRPPFASFCTMMGCCGQFWKTGVSLSERIHLGTIRRICRLNHLTNARGISVIVTQKWFHFRFIATHQFKLQTCVVHVAHDSQNYESSLDVFW